MGDQVITGNNICTPEGMRRAFVLVQDGVIADVVSTWPEGSFPVITDLQHKVLMPGIIDPHVHINEPGRTEWEGFDTATRAAAAGGITMLVDMPLNASPVTTTLSAFDKKLSAAGNTLHTHCGFWGGIVPGNEQEIIPLIKKGVLGFKAFLTHSGIDEFPNVTEKDLVKVMPVIARHGLPLLVHCELVTDKSSDLPVNKKSYPRYLASRPRQWEDEAIALMIRLCEQCNCRVHIVHLSSADSIARISKAKQKGLPLTVETAQHYLYFNAEDIPDAKPVFKCAPPIREKENNDRLWQALADEIIDFVATDHSPAPPAMKELNTGDLFAAWGGIASLQWALPVLWTAAKKRNIPFTRMAEWLCEKPALLAGQAKKGKIAPGYDADFVVWDPEKKFSIAPNNIHHRHKITPYLGEELCGVVEQTWLGGEKIFDNGTFVQLKKGKIITRSHYE